MPPSDVEDLGGFLHGVERGADLERNAVAQLQLVERDAARSLCACATRPFVRQPSNSGTVATIAAFQVVPDDESVLRPRLRLPQPAAKSTRGLLPAVAIVTSSP